MKSSSLLNYITSSDVRKSIVYRLLEGPLSLTELKGLLDVSSPYIVPRLKELECKNLIYKNNGKYRLTFIGETLVKNLWETDRLFQLLDGHARFFKDHDLSSVPESLLDRIGEMGACRLIQNSMENINATYNEVIGNLSGSSSFMGISPMFDAHLPEIVVSIAQRNIPVYIILTQDIYEKVKEDYADVLRAYLKCENAGLYVIDDARLVFVVTEILVSISLYNKNGGFDAQTNLMSFDRTALKWGEELFEYYRQRSRQIKP